MYEIAQPLDQRRPDLHKGAGRMLCTLQLSSLSLSSVATNVCVAVPLDVLLCGRIRSERRAGSLSSVSTATAVFVRVDTAENCEVAASMRCWNRRRNAFTIGGEEFGVSASNCLDRY